MTQRIFDVENEKDMQDLWNIVPDDASYAKKTSDGATFYSFDGVSLYYTCELININWHDKTEITRPMQEATEADVGKLCIFWNDTNGLNLPVYKVLFGIKNGLYETFDGISINTIYTHARRLTKQEIEELC